MKRIVVLNIILIMAEFTFIEAQNTFFQRERLNQIGISFENAFFENSKLQKSKKTNSTQDWWEPDTIWLFFDRDHSSERVIFHYNSHGLLNERITQRYDYNCVWKNYEICLLTYDSNDNKITETIGDFLITYTYDSNNNILTCLLQDLRYNTANQFCFTYDSNNNMLTELYQYWDINSNSWINVSFYTFTYDTNGNMISNIIQKAADNSWLDHRLFTYTYDSNNNMITKIEYYWRNDSLIQLTPSTYTYDHNNNLLSELQGSTLYTYTYDSNNNLLTKLIQSWTGNSFRDVYKFLMEYDENNNGTLSECWFFWIKDGEWDWQPDNARNVGNNIFYNNMQSTFGLVEYHKITASYKKVSDFTNKTEPVFPDKSNTISIYPNPTIGELRIRNYETTFGVSPLGIEGVEIYDIMGKKLSTFNYQLSTINSIDISHLPAGIYFMRITTEKGVVTKKVVKK